ncbi:DarT ssDNA thymidine ADP-ribosyltransferase family protein [Okeania sp.]|uniref:DarT ssDNA thymidine ADP-ribosyltransferase family protein n=1 Tax=Okeania sp. TaxID=3100323 RepID=UPI002B4B0F9B|nr:DarT ssDNA thymidine ADP-ribosyltransferase family protein [Okeania sp.]MEB3340507.1 DarT ssDNA thymidine ADP-ribosyltransferase family protein [Okeania sp.]
MVHKTSIQNLFYITHIENIISILEKGILSHQLIEYNQLKPTTIYNSQIVDNRYQKIVFNNKSLWSFANLYFQPINAMLYSIIHKYAIEEIVIISVKRDILTRRDIWITTGNAAHNDSEIISIQEAEELNILKQIKKETDKEWWSNEDGSKRKIMAECLVPDVVPATNIQTIYVACEKANQSLRDTFARNNYGKNISIVVEPTKFFQPEWSRKLTENISLIRGDMFFSNMQTLTVSVNCVGVMGKGLASTAKYRFPDVYVRYQEVCKSKYLQIGKPYLYKRESSVKEQLGDSKFFLPQDFLNNEQKWFLLFPTKKHWRNASEIEDIKNGLEWLANNYQKQGIKSLAMPALGRGLGGLDWEDVGPLMCKYLTSMDITVAIYLPAEKKLDERLISPDFLLSQVVDF